MIQAKSVFKKRRIALIATMFLFLTGCGYTTRSSIYPAGTTIFIKPFINNVNIAEETSENNRLISYFPMLETKVTNTVVDRFIFDGNLKTGRLETSDLILEGEVVRYSHNALQYADNNEDVKEFRATLFVNIRLKDAKTLKLLWEENNFAGEATYYTQGPQIKSETAAVEEAIEDLARRIVERIVESW